MCIRDSAHIGQVGKELHTLDELLAGTLTTLLAALDAEGEDGAGALRQILSRQRMIGTVSYTHLTLPTSDLV
mgnify:CR=1 FL=1